MKATSGPEQRYRCRGCGMITTGARFQNHAPTCPLAADVGTLQHAIVILARYKTSLSELTVARATGDLQDAVTRIGQSAE